METIEDLRLLLLGDPGAAILDQEFDFSLPEPGAQDDRGVRRRELHRVVDEVPKDLLRAVRVEDHELGGVGAHPELDAITAVAEGRDHVRQEPLRCNGLG